VGKDFLDDCDGRTVILDATNGNCILDPDAVARQQAEASICQLQREDAEMKQLHSLPDETRDGEPFELLANCFGPEDIDTAMQSGAKGVGLLRSGYMMLPGRILDEQEQYFFYCSCLAAAQGRQVTVRTFDFGSDRTISDAYYPELAGILFQLAVRVQKATGVHIAYINLSGGVGIPYRPEQTENDIMAIGEGVRKKFEEILVPAGMGDVSIFTEMGRFTTGPYGALVATAIHEKHIYKEYIGLDACAANLMRPAMYGAYHHITVLGKEDAPHDHKYDVVGGLCENNDKFAIDRMLPKIDIGDIVYIHDTGAHGSAMGYNYNGKLRSAEVLLCEDGSHRLIRRAETPRDYFATLDFLPFMKPLLGEYNDD
jgi:hypothetical protein